MVRVWPALLVTLAACFAPRVTPCASNADCAGGQVCDVGRVDPVCVSTLPPGDGPAQPDAPPADADVDPLGPWGPATVLSFAESNDDDPTLTADMLEMVFDRTGDLFVVTRPSLQADWGTPARIAELSTAMGETTCEMSLDGLTIFFASNRLGQVDIFTSTRASRASAWSAPVPVAELNSPADDAAGGISSDGLEIQLASIRSGDFQIYSSTRPDTASPWTAPALISEVDSPFQDESAFLADDLTMYFDADRQGTGDFDIFRAHRPSRTAPFGPPQRVDSIDTTMRDHDPWVSPDGHHMFFMSNRAAGVLLLYEASR